MKYSTKWFLIIFLILIVLFSCLGNILQEGFIEGHNNGCKKRNKCNKKSCNKCNKNNKNNMGNRQGFAGGYGPQGGDDGSNMNGIHASNIPEQDKNLYILKSKIVPPVCPVCPPPLLSCKEKKCQPCPPCARCPEPAFDCKKVPNYNSSNRKYLPKPILNSFGQF